jgi:hypothetical protein
MIPTENSTDRKSRFLNILVAKKLKQKFTDNKEKAIALLTQSFKDNPPNFFTEQWFIILNNERKNAILSILVKKGEPYSSLRQTSPFFFILEQKERTERLKKWESMRDKSSN